MIVTTKTHTTGPLTMGHFAGRGYVRRRHRGMGDIPGCGPSSLQEAFGNLTATGGTYGASAADLAALAQTLCQEGGAGSIFGCPPMAGCDPASIASTVAATPLNPLRTGYAPGFGPAPATYWSSAPPAVTSVAYSSPPPPPQLQIQQATQTQGQSVSVQIQNTTRPGSANFQVGDSWQITISGPANAPVASSATQNGNSLGTTPFGSTNANGQMVLTGVMGTAQIGSWVENWTVGGQSAGSLVFSVTTAGASTGGGTTQITTGTDVTSIITGAASGVPSWVWWGAAALAGVFVVKGLVKS